MRGLQVHCMKIGDLLPTGSRGVRQTYLLGTVQKKFCLKPSLVRGKKTEPTLLETNKAKLNLAAASP